MTGGTFTKTYATEAERVRAQHNHEWLSHHAAPMTVPPITGSGPGKLTFAWTDGRHAEPRDLEQLARHLGACHEAAWRSTLHKARLTTAYVSDGHVLASFIGPRATALCERFRVGYVASAQALDATLALLHRTADRPAAFYKDTNPRNILIPASGPPVTVDTDDLTLAPFAYDLAKLVVTLSMTYGQLPVALIDRALTAYNTAAAAHHARLGEITLTQLMEYAELHGILTAPYVGRGGYRRPWPHVRPTPTPRSPTCP
ncbi:phosphotransferase [Streptomyces justiciae]|uniref:phosphotransferase n=1 Tax=Streptomyces justiciae TaxID=2780140 RepID=UPI00187E82AC|nr:phosphotransferase [Streptomyces justiciae]MBE8477512.1 phosphotransferase [Streptomyces justiciae]